ncbi:MAG TPA: hypothetical protein VKE22_13065 [Haliangiales bacterium]|nr:hypothetical protein [Haliangiales bacterium]
MKDVDPRALELLEKFVRAHHDRVGAKHHAEYRAAADALEAAKLREREARREWDDARAAVVAAQRALDDLWADWEEASRDMAPELRAELRAELAELGRQLRMLKKD